MADLDTATKKPEFNQTDINYRRALSRPPVIGSTIDFHSHLLSSRHATGWFAAMDHYGLDLCVSMTPLEEVIGLQRNWGHRLRFIAVSRWGEGSGEFVDDWLRRLEMFYNLGSRMMKFHMAPGSLAARKLRLDSPQLRPLFQMAKDRKMGIMTHIGDPDTWYKGRYAEAAKWGTRQEHYAMWEAALEAHRGIPWVGAHMGGNPEDLERLQNLLDRFPDLSLDCSATKWLVRELCPQAERARQFFITNQDRIIFGTDQVSGDDRGFDFLASRLWTHRRLWESDCDVPSPIYDPDLVPECQLRLRGLNLPKAVLQKLYCGNGAALLNKLGMGFDQDSARG